MFHLFFSAMLSAIGKDVQLVGHVSAFSVQS